MKDRKCSEVVKEVVGWGVNHSWMKNKKDLHNLCLKISTDINQNMDNFLTDIWDPIISMINNLDQIILSMEYPWTIQLKK